MRFNKFGFALVLVALTLGTLQAQGRSSAQDKTTGSIKGKVKVEVGNASGVTVILRKGDKEISQTTTDKSGEFLMSRVVPGVYGLTFRKPGLSIGTIENIEVKAGQKRTLGDRLVLTIDEGSIAFIRGSVFSGEGRSVANAKVELSKINEDGSVKKIDGRLTNETGSFVFRLAPEVAKYRVSVKVEKSDPISKDIEIDGAAVYRVALSLPPKS
jgi:carboxypeptidase family protein